jgi:pre-mRNA-processing factor 17
MAVLWFSFDNSEMDALGLPIDDETENAIQEEPKSSALTIKAAPGIQNDAVALTSKTATQLSRRVATVNIPYDQMIMPVLGPSNFFSKPMDDTKNTRMGYVEPLFMPEQSFEDQRRTFHSYGYAIDPAKEFQPLTQDSFIGDKEKAKANNGMLVSEKSVDRKQKKRKRYDRGDPGDIDGFLGPWAAYEGEVQDAQEDVLEEAEEQRIEKGAVDKIKSQEDQTEIEETHEETQFHGSTERDYLGRSFLHPPADVDYDLSRDPSAHECYLPKKTVAKYVGHSSGVNAVRFFPKSGHLLLSASMDGKVKIWDVYHERSCLRTYIGHRKGVKNAVFNYDGTQFLSCSLDKYVKLWDTETGKCSLRLQHDNSAYCMAVNPNDHNILLTGLSDSKILQWDLRSGQISQKYDQHTGAVHSITFLEQNNQFVSTSEDKTVRLWELNTPVSIRYSSDPAMGHLSSGLIHPEGEWLAFQSGSRVIVCSADEKLQLNTKKVFKGHKTFRMNCHIDFSPDGQYLVSGDSEGYYAIWDWNTCKLLKRIKVHEKGCGGVAWNPQLPSTVATGSKDTQVLLNE